MEMVEELSIEDDFSDGADSISAFASALADKTVSEVQGYQEAKAEAEVIAQERLEAEAAAEAARKAEEERKAAEEAARKAEEERLAKRRDCGFCAAVCGESLCLWWYESD